MERCSTPRLRFDKEHGNGHIALVCPDEVIGTSDERQIPLSNNVHHSSALKFISDIPSTT
jgi:hypothetical protein